MFSALIYVSEESVINAMVAARTMTGADYCVGPALPQDQLQEVLRKHGSTEYSNHEKASELLTASY